MTIPKFHQAPLLFKKKKMTVQEIGGFAETSFQKSGFKQPKGAA